jgi:DNA-binding winged helix-turn-helix (wHTH) protein
MDPERSAFRFAEFTFDPASGELKNVSSGAITARLQPQVASLLTALLERPGNVVTRAELQARLWPDTTVDFDDGLNFSVRQLRLALGDDAGAPRFVETLARRGYRFIAPVTRVAEPAAPLARTAPPRGRRRAGFIVVVAIVAVAVWSQTSRKPPHTGASLAVVPFLFDTTDSTMRNYQRQLVDQVNAGVRSPSWDLVTDTSAATHVLSGGLKRRGFSVEVFVQLVRRPGRRHLWADSILDSYAFQGNSTLTADRIVRSVTRLLQSDTTTAGPK